jgi:mitogen-activated protein kinase 1/3
MLLLLLTVHKDDISREQLKELLYEEIMSFNPAPITA